MKSLTLSMLPLLLEYLSGWEVSECDTWPHKRPWLPEECQRCFHACDARGLVPGTSISDRFLFTLPFCFCVDAEKPARTLRHLCFAAPLLLTPFFVAFVLTRKRKKKKTAKVKSPQSASNQRSSPFLPLFFSSDFSVSGCPLAPVACFPSV